MQRNTKNKKAALTPQHIRKYTLNFWKILIGAGLLFVLFLVSVGMGLFGKLPSFRDLENPKSNLASEIISDDGLVLGTYYVQNRSNVTYNELSPALIQALIATEDTRFNSHSGIDFRRTFTIIFYNLVGKKQGASTITQQLALNLFSDGRSKSTSRRVIQKFQEWITAVRLERNYTKEEILTMYLNTVDFGAYNTYGIKSAAKTYFNTTPAKLTVPQAAVLVGMLKGPGIYSPIRYPENALRRRNTVLNAMQKDGFLSAAETEAYKKDPIELDFRPNSYGDGLAPYFRATLKSEIKRTFNELSITKADGTPYDLDRDGLKIYTTIDSRMQAFAEEAQKEWMQELQVQFNNQFKGVKDPFKGMEDVVTHGIKQSDRYRILNQQGLSESEIDKNFNTPVRMTIFSWKGNIDTTMTPLDSVKYNKLILRNALMSMEPQTGYVRAWVGGINFEHYKYDQVKTGTRQVGSTAKPFTYAVAIDNGYSPCFQVPNAPITVQSATSEPWTPRGESVIAGPITLKKALANSQNYATADMINRVGPQEVANLIRSFGITTEVPPYPSISLGSFEASIYDMVGAYSTFVNHGVWNKPLYLLRIEDKNGAVIYNNSPQVKVVFNDQSAYVMVDMLKNVVTGGSAIRLRTRYGLTNPIGGKTGTSNSNSDAWFIGITPQLVTGVWTGGDERRIRFRSTAFGQGAHAALPIFALYMKKIYASSDLQYSKGDFELPEGGLTRELDCSKYDQAPPAEEIKNETENRLDF